MARHVLNPSRLLARFQALRTEKVDPSATKARFDTNPKGLERRQGESRRSQDLFEPTGKILAQRANWQR